MKKLMILAVAMVAMAMGGKADAAIRLVVTYGSTTEVFYANTSTTGPNFTSNNLQANFAFSSGGVEFAGTVDTLTTNAPGSPTSGQITQNIALNLSNTTASVVDLDKLTITLSIVANGLIGAPAYVSGTKVLNPLTPGDAATILAQPMAPFTSPSNTNGLVSDGVSVTATDVNLLNQTNKVATIKSTSTVYIPGAINIVDGPISPLSTGSASHSSMVIPIPNTGYGLSNTLVIENLAIAASSDVAASFTSSLTVTKTDRPVNIVPEPTSLALAGFAGIGMAVGAIRRRRQAKQAA